VPSSSAWSCSTLAAAVVVLEEGVPASGGGAAAVCALALSAGWVDASKAGAVARAWRFFGCATCWESSTVLDAGSLPPGRRGVCGAEGGDRALSCCGAGALGESGSTRHHENTQIKKMLAVVKSCLALGCLAREEGEERRTFCLVRKFFLPWGKECKRWGALCLRLCALLCRNQRINPTAV